MFRKKKNPVEYVALEGTIFDSIYTPACKLTFNTYMSSGYSFSMDTEYGRKGIMVLQSGHVTKECVAALIGKGTKVRVSGINRKRLEDTFFQAYTEEIKSLK